VAGQLPREGDGESLTRDLLDHAMGSSISGATRTGSQRVSGLGWMGFSARVFFGELPEELVSACWQLRVIPRVPSS
jgi:hypothetical protein